MAQPFYPGRVLTSTNNYQDNRFPTSGYCNLSIVNDGTNDLVLSTDGKTTNLYLLHPNESKTWGYNNFTSDSGFVYVKSSVNNSSSTFRIDLW